MRIAGIVVLAGVLAGAVVAWCLVSGKPVSQIGVDVVTAATRPKAPSHSNNDSKPKAPTQAEDEAVIAEAVFRYEFQNNTATDASAAVAYFIGFGSATSPKDPSAEFLKRFDNNNPPVKPASLSKRAAEGAVVEKATGKPGILFRVERITWNSKDAVTVLGGFNQNAKTSSKETFKLTRQAELWMVKEAKTAS